MEEIPRRTPSASEALAPAKMSERAGRVFAFLDEFVASLPLTPGYRNLLRAHLSERAKRTETTPGVVSAVQLPLLVYAAITGEEEEPALPAAAGCTLLRLGTDLFDNVLDRDPLPSCWQECDPGEPLLAATTLLSALPQLTVAWSTPAATHGAFARLFAETLLAMSAGEHEDLTFPNREDVSPEDAVAMVARKSGSESAMSAKAGALLATRDISTIEAYAAFGLYLGVARQLVSDVWDIWGGGESQDLLNGKRTLPVVHALSALEGERRERLTQLLALARLSADHHDETRAMLAEAGSVSYTASAVCLYQRRAAEHLAAASPLEPAAGELRILLEQTSLMPRPSYPPRLQDAVS